ncbi:MarR family winged helix-turn-helix transcriptional regulator [Desulfosediminicola sp.]|uniref:MarR family winged helix-turn-helix transcriptional regulator n=1 Tax=Desulfosediminicola sp. TaxID=2886825 RepID=UPI003AF230C6
MFEKNSRSHAVTQQLRILFKAMQAHSKTVEKACGLSSAQLWMLYEVAQTPGLKVSQLATLLSIHASTCSNMLDKLERKNLIARDRSKTDQRSVHLSVTEAGKELLTMAPSPPQGKLSEALDQLGEEQLTKLESSLGSLINALNLKDDKAGFTPIPFE